MTTHADEETATEKTFAAILYLILIVPSLLLRGFVVQKLWHWFVAPLGVIDLKLIHAMGISLIASFLTYQIQDKSTDFQTPKFSALTSCCTSILYSLIAWGIGAIYVGFMK